MPGNVMNAVLCAIIAVAIPGLAAQPFVLSNPMNADEWRIEVVDFGQNDVGQKSSIALDSNGFPHISYEDNDADDIKYARWNGSAWSIETVDKSSDGPNSIDIDSKGNPHIVHTIHNLRYLWWNGANWRGTTLDISEVMGYTQIVIDDQDNPHIAYVRNLEQLRYMYWDGDKWVSEIVASGGLILGAQLALDSIGTPHIAFDLSNRVHYATRDGGNWSFEVVDTTTHIGSDDRILIAVDSNGLPHISYRSSFDRNLLYARWDAGGWLIETVDTDSIGIGLSMVLGKDDYPRISHRGRQCLKFAKWTGNEWKIEDIDCGDVHHESALALDSSGNPHISYQKEVGDPYFVRHNLYYATKGMPAQPSELMLDIDPDTLNLKSEGRWITAYLRGGNAEDIDASSLLLNDIISPAWWDLQNDTTLMAKFSRSYVQMIVPIADEVDIKVTGQWKDGQDFELHDTIRVIDPGSYLEAPGSLSSHDGSVDHPEKEYRVFTPVMEQTECHRVWFRI